MLSWNHASCTCSWLMLLSLICSAQAFRQCYRHSCSIPSSSRPLAARKRKEELDLMLIGMGLQPVQPTRTNAKPNASSQPPHMPSQPLQSLLIEVSADLSLKMQLDYARNGHTVLKSLLDPELLSNVRTDVLRYTSQKTLDAWRQKVEVASNSPKRAQSCHTVEECQQELETLGMLDDTIPFLQLFNAWRHLPSIQALSVALGKVAATLMDVASVRLYQDSIFWKRSHDGPTPWHTDARMAPFDTSNFITLWIPLQDIPQHGSGLIFCSKSHADFALPFWNAMDGPEFDRLEERYSKNGSATKHYMPLALGDVTAHAGWTLHCADAVQGSGHDRYALAISYVDAAAQVRETALDFTPPSSSTRNGGGDGYGDNEDQWSYRDWVNDVVPRTPIRHDLVPIVWPISPPPPPSGKTR